MSIESLSNCQCVITGPVTFRADRKVDNKILDHGRCRYRRDFRMPVRYRVGSTSRTTDLPSSWVR